MKNTHPLIKKSKNSDKWYCPRCQRIAPKNDLQNPNLSHGNCFKPHMYLKRLGKPPLDRWQCQDCHLIGKYHKFREIECSVTPPICKYCGERPECAKDCLGCFLALSDPDIDVIGPKQFEENPMEPQHSECWDCGMTFTLSQLYCAKTGNPVSDCSCLECPSYCEGCFEIEEN